MLEKDTVLLINLASKGDEDAFADLTVRYKPLIDSMAHSYYKKCESGVFARDDFLQEATLAFYSAVCTYDTSSSVTFGLYSKICIRNKMVSMLRASAKKEKKDKKHQKERATWREPVQNLLEKENAQDLKKKIQGVLSVFEWSVFCLYVEKKSYSEIADALGKAEKSVDNAIYRIKTKLKKLIE